MRPQSRPLELSISVETYAEKYISGGVVSRPVTRRLGSRASAANQLDDGERCAEHRCSEKEVRDIFESIRLEPPDDVPSVKKRQHAFSAESKQASDEERHKESVRIHLQRARSENESCKRKRRRHQVQNRKGKRSFGLYFLTDLCEPASRDESFQAHITHTAANVIGHGGAAKRACGCDDRINPEQVAGSRCQDNHRDVDGKW